MPSQTQTIEKKEKTSRILKKKSMFDEPLILETLSRLHLSSVHAKQLWRHLTQTTIRDLPKSFVEELLRDYVVCTSKVVKEDIASDGSTTKLLIELQDGLRVESVIMRYGHVQLDTFPETEQSKQAFRPDGSQKFACGKRATLCVSSQVGCSMGCTFCATGTMGLLANLTPGEILEQLFHATHLTPIRGIVFMGMGEPLDNYTAVICAIRAMTDTARFSLSPSRVSISTVGVVPRILGLIRDAPEVGFALSLHAPNQTLREQIVPTVTLYNRRLWKAKAWHITKIMDAVETLITHQNKKTSKNRLRRVLIEYVMISQINDMPEIAHELGALLQNKSVLLNLIPYNPTNVKYKYESPTEEAKLRFVEIVRTYGVFTVLRQTMGRDIDGACGQLVIKQSGIESSAKIEDVNDLVMRGSVVRKEKVKAMLGSVKYASTIKRETEALEKERESTGIDSDEEVEEKTVENRGLMMRVKDGVSGYVLGCLVVLLLAMLMFRNF